MNHQSTTNGSEWNVGKIILWQTRSEAGAKRRQRSGNNFKYRNKEKNHFATKLFCQHPHSSVVIRGALLILLMVVLSGCATRQYATPRNAQAKIYTMETTGYCKCKKCCGWKRNWLFQPVFTSGSSKGKRKEVGVTASGTNARPGTLAADTRYFPFGTVFYIPQYGYGRVEDIGGAIKGMHIDLYFRTHEEALQWGRRKMKVTVWKAGR